jgi:hypothetical protein
MKANSNSALKNFVVEIEGRAVLAVSSSSINRARQICSESWFEDELLRFRSLGLSVWDGRTKLCIRCANYVEIAELEIAQAKEIAAGEHDNIVFAFLIPIDPEAH